MSNMASSLYDLSDVWANLTADPLDGRLTHFRDPDGNVLTLVVYSSR